MNLLLYLSFLTSYALSLETVGNVVTINSASDFIEFSNNVNSGISYSGSTVLLGDDLDFTGLSEQFVPVGLSHDIYFNGTFNGQGHTVSNLAIQSSNQFVGLFGIVNASSFKNVVVDSSCSVNSTYGFSNYFSYTAGVLAYGFPTNGDASSLIEGCVNMAPITFSGKFTEKKESDTITISVAGIIGFYLPDITDVTVKDCVNYGVITHAGLCNVASLSGIVAAFFRSTLFSGTKCKVKNCANYGNIVHDGETTNMVGVGGIIGTTLGGTVENCINYAVFITNSESTAIGKIAGGANNQLSISNCFWTDEKDTNKTWGYEYLSVPTKENTFHAKSNETTLTLLNDWAEDAEENDPDVLYGRWIMVHTNGGAVANAKYDTVITMKSLPVIDPTKEGYNFIHWCTDANCSTGEYNGVSDNLTDLYAVWSINTYTITFDLGNGTIIEVPFTYNDTVVYPDVTNLKKFYGWNITLDTMPARNVTIGQVPPPEKSSSNTGAIVGGVIGAIALIVIVVAVVLFVISKKSPNTWDLLLNGGRRRDSELDKYYSRMVERYREGDGNTNTFDSTEVVGNQNHYADLYPAGYAPPSIKEALMEAGLPEAMAKRAEDMCMAAANEAEKAGKLVNGITKEEYAAVALYTFEFGPEAVESSPFRLLNNALTGNSADMQKVRGLFYLVMRGLRKVPRCTGNTLYRGMKRSIDRSAYGNGKIVVFHGFSSTSVNIKTVKEFLAMSGPNDDDSGGTLFVIEEAWGYDLQPYSFFPEDKEILLEPERYFGVQSVIESETTVVNLKMLDTPPVLAQLLGNGVTVIQ